MKVKFDMGECTINSIKMVDVINQQSKNNKKIDVMRKIMINEIVANKLTKILKMHMHSCTVILVIKKIKMILVQIYEESTMYFINFNE